MDTSTDRVPEACIGAVAYALGVSKSVRLTALLRLILGRAVRRFATLICSVDDEIGKNGLAAGAGQLLRRFVAGHEAAGVGHIPPTGPLLIVANHPGAYDAAVIAAHVQRPDLKFVVRDVAVFRHLPHFSSHAIFTPKGKNAFLRIRPARECIRHLRNGGALLMFPRGRLEPDPACMPGADSELHNWSRAMAMLIARVPETQVVVAAVGGVIAPSALRNPLTRFRRSRKDRQRLAFMYQLGRQALSRGEVFGLRPRVTFGSVVSIDEQAEIMTAVESSARQTLIRHQLVSLPPVAATAYRRAESRP